MITVAGPMDLCNGLIMSRTPSGSGGSTVQLTMAACAANRHAIDGVTYRLVWTGPKAEAFYQAHGPILRSGRRLQVRGINPLPVIDRGQLCTMLDVLDIEIVDRVGGAVSMTQTPAVRWVDHEGGT